MKKIFVIFILIVLFSLSVGLVSAINITIIHPVNDTIYTIAQIDLNWSVNETTDWCAYSLDSQDNDTSIYYNYEYQENVTSYSCNGTFHPISPCVNIVDTNWYSYADGYSVEGYIYLNYTKPTGAQRLLSKWQVKDSYSGISEPRPIFNLTIIESCWNQEPLQFRGLADWGPYATGWYCWNSTDWYELRYTLHPDTPRLYEEAMWWYVKEAVNITITVSDGSHNITIFCNDTSGNMWQSSIVSFTAFSLYPPIITVYSPTVYVFDAAYTSVISFDIEVTDNNTEDNITYVWTVNDVVKSTDEDYDYTVEDPLGSIKVVNVTVYDNSLMNYTDSERWTLTVTNLGYSETYSMPDLSSIVIDGVGTAGASVVDWTDVLVLLGVLSIIAVIGIGYYMNVKK